MDTELQFDQVPRPAGTSCSACHGALLGSYWQANGHTLCAQCAENVRNTFAGKSGGFLRLMKATGLGIGGGVAGGAVYAAVLAIAHINAALVTILIGWLVGKGVSKGCGGRGGVGYQILAVVITYLSIGFFATLAEVVTGEEARSFLANAFICVFGAFAGAVLMASNSILSGIITFFGLLQAWQSNKAVQVEVTGPHALAPVAPVAPVAPTLPESA